MHLLIILRMCVSLLGVFCSTIFSCLGAVLYLPTCNLLINVLINRLNILTIVICRYQHQSNLFWDGDTGRTCHRYQDKKSCLFWDVSAVVRDINIKAQIASVLGWC